MWHLDESRARLGIPPLDATIDLEHPEAGLSQIRVDGRSLPRAALLQIHSLEGAGTGRRVRPTAYVRGSDLVASYQISQTPEVSAEIYWRAMPADQAVLGGVELIVSVQTSLLDSDPRITVGSRISAVELNEIVDSPTAPLLRLIRPETLSTPTVVMSGALLYRLPEVPVSYVEMVHPSDSSDLEVSCDASQGSEFSSRFRLFDARLEKGVIRRGRLRGLVLPRAADERAAIGCYRQFIESAVPLTT